MTRCGVPIPPAPCEHRQGERLILRREIRRWFLHGRPVTTGTELLLLLPQGSVLPVTFVAGTANEPYLYLQLGDLVEPRFEIRADLGDGFRLYDRQRQVLVSLDDLLELVDDGAAPETADRWQNPSEASAVLNRLEMRDRHQVVISGLVATLLWPPVQ